jgi:hypothetical protein
MNFNGKYFLSIFKDHEEYFDGVVMRTYHTKPVPGEKPPPMKPGFKVGNDKEHFCKEGKRLIRDKSLIPNDDDTVMEFSSFGKDKRGKYKGIGMHDDTVMACLNISRLYNEPFYEDRLYDIFEKMDLTPQKDLMNLYLERAEMGDEIDDGTFNALYGNEDTYFSPEIKNINDIFKAGEEFKKRYSRRRNMGFKKG